MIDQFSFNSTFEPKEDEIWIITFGIIIDNFDDDLMDLVEAYPGQEEDHLYRWSMERDYSQKDPEVVMILAALTKILGHDKRVYQPMEVLLMAAWGKHGLLDRPSVLLEMSSIGLNAQEVTWCTILRWERKNISEPGCLTTPDTTDTQGEPVV